MKAALQIAYCHLLFNLTGILLFYPIPALRWPLTLCKILGKTTANYRWFAIFYLTNMFFVVPAIVIGLSLAGNVIFFSVITPALIIFLGAIFINVAQVKIPHKLPDTGPQGTSGQLGFCLLPTRHVCVSSRLSYWDIFCSTSRRYKLSWS